MEGREEVKEESTFKLPPGFRFHPSDEELITYYLVNKISDANFTARAIADVDLNKCEPWDLPGKAKMGVKEWYFFSLRDRKYPTGVRTNRATSTGYWKTTGKDKEIYNTTTTTTTSLELIGMKKTLVFYRGRAPRGEKTNWVMHEYRIHSKSEYRINKQDEWVVCRVFQKSGVKKYPSSHSRLVVNPFTYNLQELPQNPMQPQPMQQPDNNFHFPGRSSYMANNPADIQEFNKVFRGGSGSMINIPIPRQGHYGIGSGEGVGGTFTISGLNLNLSRGAAPTQPLMRPAPPPGMNQHDVITPSMHLAGGVEIGNEDMNNASTGNNRFMAMEHCADLDNYWPAY